MGKEVLSKETLNEIFQAAPHILRFPATRMWMDYDKEADVLYLSFKRPLKAMTPKCWKTAFSCAARMTN